MCVVVQSLSCVQLFVTLWTIACQGPLSMEFSRQEYWSGLLFPSPKLYILPPFFLKHRVLPKSRYQFSSVTQSSLTLCNPMNCSMPGSSVHGIFQTRILEWVAISSSRGSSQPRDRTQVSCTAGRFF